MRRAKRNNKRVGNRPRKCESENGLNVDASDKHDDFQDQDKMEGEEARLVPVLFHEASTASSHSYLQFCANDSSAYVR